MHAFEERIKQQTRLLVLINFCLTGLIPSLFGQSFEVVPEFGFVSALYNTTGVSVADYDRDGDLDVFLVAADQFDPEDETSWSRLLRNEGNNQFQDVTQEANLINMQTVSRYGTMGAKMGASWGDYDNDGYPDLFLANYGLDELWHNEGDGTFRNVTEEMGIAGCLFCYSATGLWWDYDRDGDLDLYVSDWVKPNRLYRNDGNAVFVDISNESGLDDPGRTFSALAIDLDGDGWQDLYTINDRSGNVFFKNEGDGTFADQTESFGLTYTGSGMGVDVCDCKEEGKYEIFITSEVYVSEPNAFFVETGPNVFSNLAGTVGVEDTGWGWAARFLDADHDRDEDLYVVNGYYLEEATTDPNAFFENENGLFEDIGLELGLNNQTIAFGLEVMDIDRDGDLDMIVGNREAPATLYENTKVEGGNWIQFQLEGTESNRDAYGTDVKINCAEEEYIRYHSGVNVFGQSSKPVHFGLGPHQRVDQIELTWPNGQTEFFGPFQANQVVKLVEGKGRASDWGLQIPLYSSRIFPNPFSQNFWIQLHNLEATEVQFELYNLSGQAVFREKWEVSAQSTLPFPIIVAQELAAGIYFYILKGEGLERRGKLIKH